MDATFGFGKTSALTDIANTVNDTLSSVVNDIAARSAAVNSSPPSAPSNPGRGNTMGGPGLSAATESQMADAMAALAEGLNAQANTNTNTNTNTTSSNVGFGKSDKDTSLAENANKADTTNSTNTSSPATQDSSVTKGADLSNDIATSTESASNTDVDPSLYGVNNNTQGDTKVAGVTTPGTPATSTPDTKPAGLAGVYDVALNDLIASFGKDKAMSLIGKNPLSQVKLAKGGKAKAKSPLAMMQRKLKKA